MTKHLMSYFFGSLLDRHETPYVRLAETEYTAEFNLLARALGRRPTDSEAKEIVLRGNA